MTLQILCMCMLNSVSLHIYLQAESCYYITPYCKIISNDVVVKINESLIEKIKKRPERPLNL